MRNIAALEKVQVEALLADLSALLDTLPDDDHETMHGLRMSLQKCVTDVFGATEQEMTEHLGEVIASSKRKGVSLEN